MTDSIGGTDLANIRTKGHTIKGYWLPVPKVQVATALINQAEFRYPLADLTIDSGSSGWLTDVEEGMLFFIGTTAGAHDVMMGIIREVPTANTFYLDKKSLGDAGYSQNINIPLADNQFITVMKCFPLVTYHSEIRGEVFYKKVLEVVGDKLSNPDPVCNIGPWDWGFVGGDGELTVSLSADDSFAWGSKTITEYSWSLDGGNLATGSLTASNLTATFDPGFYVVSCTVTDSAGKTHKARKYVWALTRTGSTAPFSIRNGVSIVSDRQTRKGREMQINYRTNRPDTMYSEVYPGMSAMYVEEALFGGEPLSADDIIVDKFCGYLSMSTELLSKDIRNNQLTFKSPMLVINDIGNPSQSISEKTSSASWADITSVLSTPQGALWYLLHWHIPAILENHDMPRWSDDEVLRKQSFVFSQEVFGPKIGTLDQLIVGNVGSHSDGTLYMFHNPWKWYNATERSQATTWVTLTATDIQGEPTVQRRWLAGASQVSGYCFAYNGGDTAIPFGAKAPGQAWSQGSGKTTIPTFIVPVLEHQQRCSEVVGHAFAQEQASVLSVALTMNRNFDAFDPSIMTRIVTLDIDELKDHRGVAVDAIPMNVNRTYSVTSGSLLKTVNVEFELEYFGQPGIPIPINRGAAWNWLNDGWLPSAQWPLDNISQDFSEWDDELAFAFAVNDRGRIGRSSNFRDHGVLWEDITGDMEGHVHDICFDFTSDYIDNDFADVDDELGMYALTVDLVDSKVRIYSTPDAKAGTPVWTEEGELDLGSGTFMDAATIEASRSTSWFCAAWRMSSGTYVSRSTGSVWPAAARVDSNAYESFEALGWDLAIAMDSPSRQTLSELVDDDRWRLYTSTGTGSWGLIADAPGESREPITCAFDNGDLVVTYYLTNSSPSYETHQILGTPFVSESSDGYPKVSSEPSAQYTSTPYGIHRSFQSAAQASGELLSVSRTKAQVKVQMWYTNTGGTPGGTPAYTPPNNTFGNFSGTFELIIRLIDDEGGEAFASPTFSFTLDQDTNSDSGDFSVTEQVAYGPSPSGFTRVRYTIVVDYENNHAMAIDDVARMEIYLVSTGNFNFGAGEWSDGGVGPLDFLTVSIEPSECELDDETPFTEGKRVYRIEDPYTGSPSWNDITPEEHEPFIKRESLNFDYASGGITDLYSVASDINAGLVRDLIRANDSETDPVSWTTLRNRVDYYNIKVKGEIIVVYGQEVLGVTTDNGDSYIDRRGNWGSAIGAVGLIRRVRMLL